MRRPHPRRVAPARLAPGTGENAERLTAMGHGSMATSRPVFATPPGAEALFGFRSAEEKLCLSVQAAGGGGAGEVALGRGEGTPSRQGWFQQAVRKCWPLVAPGVRPVEWGLRLPVESQHQEHRWQKTLLPAGGELELAGNIPLRNEGNFVMTPISELSK